MHDLVTRPDNPAVLLEEARTRIERAQSVQELKTYRDQAEAMRQFARQRDASLAILNTAAEVKLRAERRMGEMLSCELQHGGSPKSRPVTLDELGVSRMESSRWQQESAVPEEVFEEFLGEKKDAGEEITQAGLLRVAKDLRREEVWQEREATAFELPDDTYQVVLADPPWQYDNATIRGAAATYYPTMPTCDIAALPVGECTAENAVLFLWATNPLLPDALEVVDAWRFTYKTKMTWVKPSIGTGTYVRGQDEPMLIATRGSMVPKVAPPSVLVSPRGEHSAKPPEAYERIESMYPGLKRVELFARGERDGWQSWGNEPALEEARP